MIAQILDRDFLLDRARYAIRLREEVAGGTVPPELAKSLQERGISLDDLRQVLDDLKQAAETTEAEPSKEVDRFAFVSSDRTLGLMQSALEQFYDSPAGRHEVLSADQPFGFTGSQPPVTDRTLSPTAAALLCDESGERRLFEKFSMTDAGWASVLLAEDYARVHGKHLFNSRPADPFPLDERARIVLVGDWATGIPRAQRVGLQIRKQLLANEGQRPQQHVIHLGDVYYSGWPREYDERFFPYWPVADDNPGLATSWCLNGNHDMYCGGSGYFGRLLTDPRFARQQGSSFFSLENQHWRILGLDSSYEDEMLAPPQAEWAIEKMQTPGPANMLLTHHQPYSAYDRFAYRLPEQLAPAIAANLVRAWFWGHEHRCTVYKSPTPVSHYGCCLGHGGIPTWADKGDPPPVVEFAFRESYSSTFEEWCRFGFATLDLEGPDIAVSYYDEDGQVTFQQTITAQ